MKKIFLLDEETINKIAAGEVIERPSSIVKELLENSLDAGSSSIAIEVKDGGKTFISISDNGSGINSEDIDLVFERHATSKITTADDLLRISTLGFRGEAMSSIAAISDVELYTKTHESQYGYYIHIKGGIYIEKREEGLPVGTTIIVRNLFFNTPARLKFLKSDMTEQSYIVDIIEKIALINTTVSFKLTIDGKLAFHTPGNGDLLSTFHCIYGRNKAKSMIRLDYSSSFITIEGYISKPELSKGNSSDMIFSVNNRVIKNRMLIECLKQAYKTLLMNNRYPICVINIKLPADKYDVNVHPSKSEIKFIDDKTIFNTVYIAIKSCLNTSLSIIEEAVDSKSDENIEKTLLPQTSVNVNHQMIMPEAFDSMKDCSISRFNKSEKENSPKVNVIYNNSISENKEVYETSIRQNILDNNVIEKIPQLLIIGQLFNTYILAQSDQVFYLIDQHAAHERILYEFLFQKYHESEIQVQELLLPIVIDLTPRDSAKLLSNLHIFSNLGFNIEIFGDNTFKISSVPIIMGEPCSGSIFSEILDSLEDNSKNLSINIEKIIIEMSCKNAVKAGKALNIEEISELINRLKQAKNPFTCPHGRPTIIKMTNYELEKKFKRVI